MGFWPGIWAEFQCRVVSSRSENVEKCKKKILDESYLEQRWGIVKHVILKRISLRFFLALPKKVNFSVEVSPSKLGGPGPAFWVLELGCFQFYICFQCYIRFQFYTVYVYSLYLFALYIRLIFIVV